MSTTVDVPTLVTRAHEALKLADSLFELGVPVEMQVKHCKLVCAIGAELTLAPNVVTGNQRFEDLIFRIKQVFERIQKANPVVPTFHDYHTVRSFTGTIHNDRERRAALAAAVLAGSTTPTEGTTEKAANVKLKPSKTAVIEDSSDEEARVIAATEEDTVMGNPDASSALPEADSMAIDEDVEIIVNRDPAAGNVVEGHKAAQAAQREKRKSECHAEVAEVTIAKWKESSFNIAAADLVIHNEASQSTIDAATALVSAGDHINPSEGILRSRESDLRNDIIATVHKIEYFLQYREFVVAHHGQVVKQLESRLSAPMETPYSFLPKGR
ncbi:hypothetical protein DFS33DRAFT_1379320 [Desarmillaria ectypa]|nr:hypothetical protein DFS33DRAFT_1379320 [Desarmillaria ectypa]